MQNGTRVIELGKLADISLTPLIKSDDRGNLRILKSNAVQGGRIDEAQLGTGLSSGRKDITPYLLTPGDIVFQAKGNKFEALLIGQSYDNLVASQIYFNIRVKDSGTNPAYLCWYLGCREAMSYFNQNSSGAVVRSLSKQVLMKLPVMIPPTLKEQDEMVTLIENFRKEKDLTLAYLKQKEALVKESLLSTLKGGLS